MKNLLLVSLFLLSTAHAGDETTLPEGWRFPTAKELSYASRNDSPTRYASAAADFNGDGVDDSAFLLKSTTFSGEGLFVHLSNKAGGFGWVKLDVTDWGKQYPDVDLSMGVAIAEPGEHATACGKGYFECSKGEPKLLNLKRPAIDYFRFESANSFFVWDEATGKFDRIWMSD